MENSTALLEIADSLGIDESFCPVRAMLGAFVDRAHFPLPGLLMCSVGATCDDFSAIAQRLEALGYPILWWEMPHRRRPEPGEPAVECPGFRAPAEQVAFVRGGTERVRQALEEYAGERLTDERLAAGIARANQVRARLAALRQLAFTADVLPAAGPGDADRRDARHPLLFRPAETIAVLDELLEEVRRRVRAGPGVRRRRRPRVLGQPCGRSARDESAGRVGGRLCGTDYMFCHALDPIPTDLPPMEALARMALADPMVGPAADRAERIAATFAASAPKRW